MDGRWPAWLRASTSANWPCSTTRPTGATVTAITPLELYVLSQREVAAVLDEWPGVSRRMLTALASRLRQAERDAATH